MRLIRRLAGLFVIALSGCADSPTDEGWSGTPPVEPAEPGDPCDDDWVTCIEGAFCDFSAKGEPALFCEEVGVCAVVTTACEANSEPICGCDGVLYANACAAAMAGVGISGAVGCPPPPGSFECGEQFCDVATEYCRHIIGHGQPEDLTCLALDCPDNVSGCDCVVAPEPCGDAQQFGAQFCDMTAESGIRLTCLPY